MHYRKKHPTKVLGNKCAMCQWHKMVGNSKAGIKRQDRRAMDRAKDEREGLPHACHR